MIKRLITFQFIYRTFESSFFSQYARKVLKPLLSPDNSDFIHFLRVLIARLNVLDVYKRQEFNNFNT